MQKAPIRRSTVFLIVITALSQITIVIGGTKAVTSPTISTVANADQFPLSDRPRARPHALQHLAKDQVAQQNPLSTHKAQLASSTCVL